jgi:hypothetical protein
MKCPYCASLLEEEVLVCKVCRRDLYLFKPLTEKIRDLEAQLKAQGDRAQLQDRVAELEGELDEVQAKLTKSTNGAVNFGSAIAQFVLIPLVLLLLSHALVTVVYDLPLVYLRVISIVLPLPFGYWLFKSKQRSLLPWFVATAFMASASVIGMSAITGWVDHTPVMPQSMVEWKEFIEYAASISFSFLTGMLIGGISYHRVHRSRSNSNSILKALVTQLGDGKLSPDAIQQIIKKLESLTGSVVTVGTTAMSIYTGLKSVL